MSNDDDLNIRILCIYADKTAPVPSELARCGTCQKPVWLSKATMADILQRVQDGQDANGTTYTPICTSCFNKVSNPKIERPGKNTMQAVFSNLTNDERFSN